MASQLRVDEIIASTGSSVAIGTAGGSVTLAGDFTVDTSKGLNVGTGATIFSPSSNVLTLGTNNAERVRITSTGNVGIGTDNPTTKLYAYDNQDGYVSYTFVNASNGTSAVNRIQIGNDASPGSAQLVVYGSQHPTLSNVFDINNANNNDMRLLTNNTERLRINSTGNVQIANGNLVFSTSGTGIDFSANSNAAGMTSELLDDYEEGTFTPDVNNSGYTSRWSSKAGRYRKVGSKVTVWINCDGGTQPRSGAGTGLLIISGLPFAINSSLNDNFVLGIIGYNKGGGGSGSADANVNYAGGVVRVRIGGSDQSDQIDYVSACFSYFV